MTNEVVVVGGGPTGLMLASEARLAGVQAIVFERLFQAHRPLQSSWTPGPDDGDVGPPRLARAI